MRLQSFFQRSCFFLLLLSSGFISCTSRKTANEKMIAGLQDQARVTVNDLNKQIQMLLQYLQEEAGVESRAERIAYWRPLAIKADSLLKDFLFQLNHFEAVPLNSKPVKLPGIDSLYAYLQDFKTGLNQLDKQLVYTFKEDLNDFLNIGKEQTGTLADFRRYWETQDEAGLVSGGCSLVRFKLVNLILRMIRYCEEQTRVTRHYHETFEAMVGQNTQHTKPGGKIEITAGVGMFRYHTKNEIIINGVRVEPLDYGAAVYAFKAPAKPGNYVVPVLFSYTDQDGIKQSRKINISYTVDKPCQ